MSSFSLRSSQSNISIIFLLSTSYHKVHDQLKSKYNHSITQHTIKVQITVRSYDNSPLWSLFDVIPIFVESCLEIL